MPQSHPVRHHIPGSVLALVVALLLAGCEALPSVPAGWLPAAAPVVTVEASGGRCVAGACSSSTEILADGTIVRPDGSRGSIEPDDMAAILRSIEATDWNAVAAIPFEGTCPTAVDGQELTWRIQTPDGPVVLADCTVAIDYGREPFRTLSGALFSAGG